MKRTKVFGAMLCSAALAMGMAMPAFAADKLVSGDGGTADTAVTITKLDATNISATVPIDLAVSVAQKGGTIVSPDASSYAIKNTGGIDVYVQKVKVTGLGDWKVKDAISADHSAQAVADNEARIVLDVNGSSTLLKATDTMTNWSISSGSNLPIKLSGEAYPSSSENSGKVTVSDITDGQFVKITYTLGKVAATA